jgi:hypothetical protein
MEPMIESDWKIFRQLHPIFVERYCQQILDESEGLQRNSSLSAHERFLALHEHFHNRNREVARLFNDPRRSTAAIQLTAIKAEGLVTDEEFSRFTQATQERVAKLPSL